MNDTMANFEEALDKETSSKRLWSDSNGAQIHAEETLPVAAPFVLALAFTFSSFIKQNPSNEDLVALPETLGCKLTRT